jgi:predicted Zn-dependent protease
VAVLNRYRSILVAACAFAACHAFAGPGEKQLEEFKAQGLVYDDPEWNAYVQKIGERLVAVSPDKGRQYHFTLVDSAAVNAFAMPDGYIFVFRGLLAFLESEDQLAGVLGHEIGHVVGNHAREAKVVSGLGSVTGFIAAVLTGQGAMMDTANAATSVLVSGYGRENELESDRFGGEFLALAGYDPYAMIDTIQVLKDQEMLEKEIGGGRATYHGLFATHPKNDKRLHDAVMHAYESGSAAAELAEPIGDFWAMIDGLVYGDEAASGLVKDTTIYHSGLRFVVAYPQGWTVSNGAQRISGRAAGGSAEGFIDLERQDAVKGQSPKEYVEDTLKRDDLLEGETLEVNGLEAYLAKVDVADGKAKAAFIAVVFKDKGVYYFKGEAGEKGDAKAFEDAFRATVGSFRPMQASDLATANKQRIKVVEAQPGDTYRSLAARSSLKNHGEDWLRTINGDYPVREPRPGDLIKIVQ